ncbi:BREX-1 system adenine-specific DNA-methyltransferase PglX [Vibrio parahaemolyticus]|uniref:BREX-1 system adenine-specific DNA-methyltransferase PglX n=1 Tax=Vibrio parahaemolyticus TaxID=670 RepID=UPI00226AD517|nr:BREX-1 system adenine-specific DNA-methyltransferase PglX [Vibrio parahaemolyticus]MCX8861849.1 BREX-1 system adenine-specific DNA-methyltransferase PglX [Vibrio parahaemolyticus]MCX8870191.1 BREX-1 system adenine-specific DNA-methyltransferase PglX [Vibrio parahaemolyticus]
MDTSRLKKFAQFARRSLIEQVQTKLKLVLAEDSLARRESPNSVKELESKKQELGEEQLLEQVAYTWFNRFCALRFMDANQYNRIMVISPVAGQFQPEILAEAKAGHLDDSVFNEKVRDEINGLLSGSIPSRDGQSEAYRLMIVAVCNDYHRLMPYLFERIEDYTELLMPDDLLSGNSILAYTREAMTPENCESVESIGWLYQFYISEKKDQVFEGLKKNKKITPENIPAATQLFTPHWIVRYLVENSLGRLWMLNNPNSKVIEQMGYYIKPVEDEKEYLKISSPEELKICDPACGSGHMLTYAYDLLYAIYLDAGYDSSEIPEKILTNNLYGIEIDERAAELAAFALSMKALKGNPLDESNNRRRFFRNPIEPNICHIQNVSFSDAELDEYFEFVGVDLFTKDIRATFKEFEEADNFGSLIQPTLKNPADVLAILDTKDVSGQLFLSDTHKSVLNALKQADYLSQKYHVIVANPPYMGSKGMNGRLAKWSKDNYPVSKADLYAMFIERNLCLAVDSGYSAMINMQSWMFLSSFEKLRSKLFGQVAITSMLHLGTRAFDSIGGEVVSTTAYVVKNKGDLYKKGTFVRLVDGRSEFEKEKTLLNALSDTKSAQLFTASTQDLTLIPGSPVAYWVTENVVRAFKGQLLRDCADAKQGMATSDNDRFLRYWFEVSKNNSCFDCQSLSESASRSEKWYAYNKGGSFRRWYGNNEYLVNWHKNGEELKEFVEELNKLRPGGRLKNQEYYFLENITYSALSSGDFSARYNAAGFIFDTKGSCIFPKHVDLDYLIAFLNSVVAQEFLNVLCPTLDYSSIGINSLPIREGFPPSSVSRIVELSKKDWDSSELSWDFQSSPLINKIGLVEDSYNSLVDNARESTNQLKYLEEENNKAFINIYQLDHLDYKVSNSEVSLNCNPDFLYGSDRSEEEKDRLFLNATIVDFLSYSVGCMFGRFSIDKSGLILANHTETLEEYLELVPQARFEPDRDNVIPLIDLKGDWFEDDMAERFKLFLKITFGEEHFSENLRFVENAIGKDVKKYFAKDFYDDHVKRYKKRPIYWMFSSTKGTFNALIYMHRYTKDTVDVVLNNYLREFRTKLLARKESLEQIEISASASQRDKTQAIKTIANINKVLDEINDYEHDVLYPLAGEKVEIDLDDGVKHNYRLFGKALKKVPGLS